jgi:hypothetical protein
MTLPICPACQRPIPPHAHGVRFYNARMYCGAVCEAQAIVDEWSKGRAACIVIGCHAPRAGRHGKCKAHHAEYVRAWMAQKRESVLPRDGMASSVGAARRRHEPAR